MTKLYAPPELSADGLKAIEALITVAVDGQLISDADAQTGFSILKTNPSRQLSNLGKRITQVEHLCQELVNNDKRVNALVENTASQWKALSELINANINWRREDE